MECPRVLLVDDTPGMTDYYKEILKAGSYDIVGSAPNGPTALKLLAVTQPDVVLLDIAMPGMSGFELATRIRAAGCRAAIIFVSSEDALVSDILEAGGSAFVSKNLVGSDLVTAIRVALSGRPFFSVWLENKP